MGTGVAWTARVIASAALGMALVSCGGIARKAAEPEPSAKAEVRGYLPNTQEGTIWFTEIPTKGLRIQGSIQGLLPERTYGVHIHENGNCENPDAAGMHFDPALSGRHGPPGESPGEHHAGDLPNVTTDADGVANIDFTTNALGVNGGAFSVVGRSIVLGSNPDDYQTQPSGGAEPEAACGVIEAAAGRSVGEG